MVKLDPRAVGFGALVTMAVGIPVATIGSVILEDGSNLVFFFALLALIGFLAGGYVAGSKRPDTPMAHGAVAALAGFVVAQAIAAVLQIVRDEEVNAIAIAFNALLAANIGLVGGLLGARRTERGESILVVDVGTSSVRAAVVRPDATVEHVHHTVTLPDSPAPGLVEFDAAALADAALHCAHAALADGGPVAAVGITNQRASTVVWDRATGEPVAPALGWQDLRTVGDCLVLQAEGIRIAPNLSATKARHLLDQADPDRSRDLCIGTVDTWIAWRLSAGTLHVTDATNAALTGFTTHDVDGWDGELLATLRIPERALPTIVDSSGIFGEARALPGAPPIAGMAGDQQASLLGQGGTSPGLAKITFGTGGMLDTVTGLERPTFHPRGGCGCFPIVAHRLDGVITWGVEAAMLSAGTNVEWLRDDLGLLPTSEASHEVAASVPDAGGAWYVPALLGLGTPHWDYGARGTLLGVTRGTTAAHVVRAVLEGIAHRGADLVEAAEADGGATITSLRVDGGMSANPTFVQALADAAGRPVEVSPVMEATTLGAAFLAGLAVGTWSSLDEIAATWRPARTVEPASTPDRDRWHEAVRRASAWIPELSALDF